MPKSRTNRQLMADKVEFYREQLDELRAKLMVEDSDTQEADETLHTVCNLLREVVGYLDRED